MKKQIQLHREKGDDAILFHVTIDASTLRVEETPFGVRFDLGKDFKLQGEPGTPAIPSRVVQVALPADASDIRIEAVIRKSKPLFKSPVVIMPMPRLQVASKLDQDQSQSSRDLVEKLKHVKMLDESESLAIPLSQPVLSPDPERYARWFHESPPVAKLLSTVVAGVNTIANVLISPITMDKNFIPQLNEDVEVLVTYERAKNIRHQPRTTVRSFTTNKAIQESIISSLKDKVINARDVIDVTRFPWELFGTYDYLIITDNKRWDAERIEPREDIGDMVASFQKLIDWKRQKGLKARIVTISDIVEGRYGNFRSGAVDLQEVIRNFMKFAHSNWGVSWCLLGGDTEVVPVRLAAGEIRGDVNEQAANNPPEKNEAYWTGTFLKVNAHSLGEWFSPSDDYLKLTNKNTGRLIPKKAPLSIFRPELIANASIKLRTHLPFRLHETLEQFRNRLGWYFCTDDTYTTYSASPTQFVRVDGPASIIHAPLRFHYTWNTIPTDFYYASLFGPSYGLPGKHDWDLNGNKIYGQHEGATEFDPINWNADVMVGRAPASSPAEADIFVSKVVSYEKFRTPEGARLDRNYVDKMLLVAENWGGRLGFGSTSLNPPGPNLFFTDTTHGRAVLRTADDLTLDWNWQLISWINDSDIRLIPYNRNAGPSSRGWYYAFSATDLRPAVVTIPLPWGSPIQFPLITHTIVIYGTATDITPAHFILDHKDPDGSMMDQEALRQQVDSELPVIQRFTRLYEDIESLPAANQGAAPLARINDVTLTNALNEGQHFVSLSGHGSQWGCCHLGNAVASGITNTNKYFIAFADSCLTNAYSHSDSMSEDLIKNPNGGAIAYLGHTRFSWIGIGDDYQRAFFHELVNTRHLGLLHNSRLNVLLTNPSWHVHKWSVLALNLLGDPEMEVWTHKPFRIIPDLRFIQDKLHIRIFYAEDFSRKPIPNVDVLIREGETQHKMTLGESGTLELTPEWLSSDALELVVTTNGSLPLVISAQEIRKLKTQFENEALREIEEADPESYTMEHEVINIPITTVPLVEAKLVDVQHEPN
jgi:hypothetical protein